ncbi:MAG: hypothetical protein Q4G46_02475 [Propionibacteriaceae bacterium]|nr:hypothetical protein [Propionibacteriaceae bacterium]
MTDDAPEELLRRWRTAAPRPCTPDDIAGVLGTYQAYPIPLGHMAPDNFAADEEVREDLVDTLWTITHPLVLDRFRTASTGEEVDDEFADSPEDQANLADSYWRDLFDEPAEELPYRVLSAQHALGQRISILLEREGTAITGFKVYGVLGGSLTRHLTALIGYPVRRPYDPVDGPFMQPGDLDDEGFADYLEAAAAHGLI